MGLILPTYADRVRYTLKMEDYGEQYISEPDGWLEDGLKFERNSDYDGIIADFSGKLTFTDDGAEFIRAIRSVYGINAKIQIIRDQRHPETDVWTTLYSGSLDMITYNEEWGKVSMEISNSSLADVIKSKRSEKVEIERHDDLDGNELTPISTKLMVLDGRDIFLKSNLVIQRPNEDWIETTGNAFRLGDGQDGMSFAFPLKVAINSEKDFIRDTRPRLNQNADETIKSPVSESGYFYTDNDRDKELYFDLDIDMLYNQGDFPSGTSRIQAYIFQTALDEAGEPDSDFPVVGDTVLWSETVVGKDNQRYVASVEDIKVTVKKGYSLALAFSFPRNPPRQGDPVGRSRYVEFDKLSLGIKNYSTFSQSLSRSVLAYELGNRLVRIMTGIRGVFHSNALGREDLGFNETGVDTGAMTAFAHGMWIRGFKADEEGEENEDNRYKPISTSFKDYMEFFNSVWALGMGIETIGFKDRVVIEPINYFYDHNVTMRLGKVANISRSETESDYYSSIIAGYEKPKGDDLYEEAMGLDEYNIKSEYSTPIKVVDSVFKKTTKYRADSYGMEFTRRKPHDGFSTEDTDADNDIFAFDTKFLIGPLLKPRIWKDDYNDKPKGVYSPKTAINLRLSPSSIVHRHGGEIRTGLEKNLNDKIRFASSEGNSKLSVEKNGITIKERDDISPRDLQKPRRLTETIKFKRDVDFQILLILQGTTKGKPNFYGTVEFINEFDEKEYGFIQSVDAKGDWELIKSNR